MPQAQRSIDQRISDQAASGGPVRIVLSFGSADTGAFVPWLRQELMRRRGYDPRTEPCAVYQDSAAFMLQLPPRDAMKKAQEHAGRLEELSATLPVDPTSQPVNLPAVQKALQDQRARPLHANIGQKVADLGDRLRGVPGSAQRTLQAHGTFRSGLAADARRLLKDQGYTDVKTFRAGDGATFAMMNDFWKILFDDAVDRCHAMVFLSTPAWWASSYCQDEAKTFAKVNRERAQRGRPPIRGVSLIFQNDARAPDPIRPKDVPQQPIAGTQALTVRRTFPHDYIKDQRTYREYQDRVRGASFKSLYRLDEASMRALAAALPADPG